MTNEERDIITNFIARVGGAPGASTGASTGAGAGSVPLAGAAVAPLPPIDKDADALIAELFTNYPEARYRLTQLAFVQEHALAEAQNCINRLQAELQQAKDAAASSQSGASPWGAGGRTQGSRGFLGGLFGGGSQPAAAPPPPAYAPPPQPAYAPGYQPGMFQPQGSGFLGSALQTAAGVAGGLVLGNALMNMFSPRSEGFGGYGGFASAPGFEPAAPAMSEPGASPWSAAAATPVADPWGSGGALKDEPAQQSGNDKFADAPPPDTSPWSTSTSDPGLGQPASGDAWSDSSSSDFDQGGSFDQGGGFDVSDSGGFNDDTV